MYTVRPQNLNPSHAEKNNVVPTSNFQPIRILETRCRYKFTFFMTNSVDTDQLASEEALHHLQRQGYSGSARPGLM